MSRMVRFLILLSFVLSVCLGQANAGTTMINYAETFLNGETFTDEVSTSPLNSASIGGDPLDGGGHPGYMGFVAYGASSNFAIGDFTELKTSAEAFVSASTDDDPYDWSSIQMTATAVSTIAAFGVVENASGASSGVVQLTWTVDGSSSAVLSNVSGATVELDSTTTLSQTTAAGTNVFTASAPDMSGATNVISSLGDYTIDIPWGETADVPVFFELKSQLTLTANNDTASGSFIANAAAVFNNTAVLDLSKTVVKGPGGTQIPSATFSLSPVPEPNSASLLVLIVAMTGCVRWYQVRIRNG